MEKPSTSASERIAEVARELLSLLPSVHEVPVRLPFLLYLIDWKSAIEHGRTITGLNWLVDAFDVYAESVIQAEGWPEIEQRVAQRLRAGDSDGVEALGAEDEEVVAFVARCFRDLPWSEFLRLVYSTYPVVSHPASSRVDLVELATEYRSQRRAAEPRNPHATRGLTSPP